MVGFNRLINNQKVNIVFFLCVFALLLCVVDKQHICTHIPHPVTATTAQHKLSRCCLFLFLSEFDQPQNLKWLYNLRRSARRISLASMECYHALQMSSM